MIPYPKLKVTPRSRRRLEVFKGLNRSVRISEGEFSELENLTSDDFPVLSSRAPRGLVSEPEGQCLGMLFVPDHGLFVALKKTDSRGEDYGALCLLTREGELRVINSLLTPEPKCFALMGSSLAIVPDMKVISLNDPVIEYPCIPMGQSWKLCLETITIQACDSQGNVLDIKTRAPTPPGSPGYRELWLDTSIPESLKQYDSDSRQWITLEHTYLRISGLGEHQCQAHDGIHISGLDSQDYCWISGLNGTHVVESCGHGYIVIAGLLTQTYTQDTGKTPVVLERQVPRLDYVVEAGNRLWGCAADKNEIYACKLGDYRNWNCFQGLSTDSYVATVGTPGSFTGAVNQGGYPIFYKEGYRHKVWPSATGAHQVSSAPWLGVEEGSGRSVAVSGGTVLYKSPQGICMDDGGGGMLISHCLGDRPFRKAVGAVYEGKYYVSMEGCAGNRSLYVYDLARKLWHREDGKGLTHLAAGPQLWGWMADKLWDLTGHTGKPEEPVSWMAQTGDLGLELPDRKYISRLTLRLLLEPGAKLDIEAQYDREPRWVKLGTVYGTELRSFSLPVRPRRCDHLRLRLTGTGQGKLYGMGKTLEKGSELW